MTVEAYVPPKVWRPATGNGGTFASINRRRLGRRTTRSYPGAATRSSSTPRTWNGMKVTILLEELLALGIGRPSTTPGSSTSSRATSSARASSLSILTPRSPPGRPRRREAVPASNREPSSFTSRSGSGASSPTENPAAWNACPGCSGRWAASLTSAAGSPLLPLCSVKIEYAIDRYAMEVKRQLDVLDRRLADRPFVAGTTTPSPTSRSSPGSAPWSSAGATTSPSSWVPMSTATSAAGRTPCRSGRRPARAAREQDAGDWPGALRERHDAADFEV